MTVILMINVHIFIVDINFFYFPFENLIFYIFCTMLNILSYLHLMNQDQSKYFIDWQACSPQWKQATSANTYMAYGKCSDIPVNGLSPNNNKFFNVPSSLQYTGGKVYYSHAEFGFSSARRVGVGVDWSWLNAYLIGWMPY